MNAKVADREKQSWDPIWEDIFVSQDWGKYPPEELIRFIARNYYKAPDRKKVSILEIGCGAGACVWFAAREGFSAVGIDGSKTAIEKAEKLLKDNDLEAEFIVGDVMHLDQLVNGRQFDAIYDVGCLQCNTLSNMQLIIDKIFDRLAAGGRFFSIAVSSESPGANKGTEIEKGTFVDIQEGPLKGRGLNHFTTLEEMQTLLSKFTSVEIDFCKRSFSNRQGFYSNWVCSAMKPKP